MNPYWWAPGSREGPSELRVTWIPTQTHPTARKPRVILRTLEIRDPLPQIWKLRPREVLCPRSQLGTGRVCLELTLSLCPILPPLSA